MREFRFNGRNWRSLRQACDRLRLDYWKAQRLCRYYIRAREDPAFALGWMTGTMNMDLHEPKTAAYLQDLANSYNRQEKFKQKLVKKSAEKYTEKNK